MTSVTENQMEKKMDIEMEIGFIEDGDQLSTCSRCLEVYVVSRRVRSTEGFKRKKGMLQKKVSKSRAALSWDCHQTIKVQNMITYELGEVREILEIMVECAL